MKKRYIYILITIYQNEDSTATTHWNIEVTTLLAYVDEYNNNYPIIASDYSIEKNEYKNKIKKIVTSWKPYHLHHVLAQIQSGVSLLTMEHL